MPGTAPPKVAQLPTAKPTPLRVKFDASAFPSTRRGSNQTSEKRRTDLSSSITALLRSKHLDDQPKLQEHINKSDFARRPLNKTSEMLMATSNLVAAATTARIDFLANTTIMAKKSSFAPVQ